MAEPNVAPEGPMIIAHRGASRLAPENTLASLALAAELGADRAEIDVQLTKDGVPVVIHDSTVDRTTDGTGAVAELTWTEIRGLHAGYPERFGRRYARQPLPSLEQVVELSVDRKLPLTIEIKVKEHQPDLVRQTIELLDQAKLLDEAWVQSFNWQAMAAVRDYTDRVPRGALAGGWPSDEAQAHAEMLMPYGPSLFAVRGPLSRRTDKPVVVWTINQQRLADRLVHKGVAGIITDQPEVMLQRYRGPRAGER
jgi:glycerophosphoryl diester phosphodiesterase